MIVLLSITEQSISMDYHQSGRRGWFKPHTSSRPSTRNINHGDGREVQITFFLCAQVIALSTIVDVSRTCFIIISHHHFFFIMHRLHFLAYCFLFLQVASNGGAISLFEDLGKLTPGEHYYFVAAADGPDDPAASDNDYFRVERRWTSYYRTNESRQQQSVFTIWWTRKRERK